MRKGKAKAKNYGSSNMTFLGFELNLVLRIIHSTWLLPLVTSS